MCACALQASNTFAFYLAKSSTAGARAVLDADVYGQPFSAYPAESRYRDKKQIQAWRLEQITWGADVNPDTKKSLRIAMELEELSEQLTACPSGDGEEDAVIMFCPECTDEDLEMEGGGGANSTPMAVTMSKLLEKNVERHALSRDRATRKNSIGRITGSGKANRGKRKVGPSGEEAKTIPPHWRWEMPDASASKQRRHSYHELGGDLTTIHKFEEAHGAIRCGLCNCPVTNKPRSITDHVGGARHREFTKQNQAKEKRRESGVLLADEAAMQQSLRLDVEEQVSGTATGWFWFGRGGREGCPGTTDNVPLKQLYILPFSFSQKHPPFSRATMRPAKPSKTDPVPCHSRTARPAPSSSGLICWAVFFSHRPGLQMGSPEWDRQGGENTPGFTLAILKAGNPRFPRGV